MEHNNSNSNGYVWYVMNTIYSLFYTDSSISIRDYDTIYPEGNDEESTDSSSYSSTSIIIESQDILQTLQDTKNKLLLVYPIELLQLIVEFSLPNCVCCSTATNLKRNNICLECYLLKSICSLCYTKSKDKNLIKWNEECQECKQILCDECAIKSTFHEIGTICPDCI